MFFKKPYIALLLFIVIGFGGWQFQCRRDCRGAVYNFEMGIKAYPDKDSINVGDTVWLEVNEPTTLTDVQTGRTINYSEAANLGLTIGIAELISVNTFNTEGIWFLDF